MKISYSTQKYVMVSHDITNHCNARCRFCFNDWEHLNPCNMSVEIFKLSRNIIPLTIKDGFLLSCLFEPTLNPEFPDILRMLPQQYKQHVFFTTNMARKLSDEELKLFLEANIDYFNISLETYNQDRYTMLSGIKNVFFMIIWIVYPLLQENWVKLRKFV